MALSLLRFLDIILAALLAGTSFGIWVGFNPAIFSASTYVEQQQNLVSSLNSLMIVLVIAATVITLLSAFLQLKNKPAFVALLLAAALFIACMVITRFGNVPVQTEILKWTVDTLPENWTDFRDKWWSFHIARTVVELVALVLITWTVVKNNPAQTK
ncbi:anthrone oxygenase family protein [Catalinimonas alkaloidigena]|nr:anthrone oxygenase family protein [Catalinimonas alkaloidigena]